MLKKIIMFALPCLVAGPLMAQETKVTLLMSKDPKEFSAKEGLMITEENVGDFVVPSPQSRWYTRRRLS